MSLLRLNWWTTLLLVALISAVMQCVVCEVSSGTLTDMDGLLAIRRHWVGLQSSWTTTDACRQAGVRCTNGRVTEIEASWFWGRESSAPLDEFYLQGLTELTTWTFASTVSLSTDAIYVMLQAPALKILSINGIAGLTNFPEMPRRASLTALTLSNMPSLTTLPPNLFNRTSSWQSITFQNIGIRQLPLGLPGDTDMSFTLANLPYLEVIPEETFTAGMILNLFNITSLPRLIKLPDKLSQLSSLSGSIYLSNLNISSIPPLPSYQYAGIQLRSLRNLRSIPWLCGWDPAAHGSFIVSNTPLSSETIDCVLASSYYEQLHFDATSAMPNTSLPWGGSLIGLTLPMTWAANNLPPPSASISYLQFLKLAYSLPLRFDGPLRHLDDFTRLFNPNLHTFSAENCNLVGAIPSVVFGNSLYSLDLSYNMLQGALPYLGLDRTSRSMAQFHVDHNRLVLCPLDFQLFSSDCSISHNIGPCDCYSVFYSCQDAICPDAGQPPFMTPTSYLPAPPLPACSAHGYVSLVNNYAVITGPTTVLCNFEVGSLVMDLSQGFDSNAGPILKLSGCLTLLRTLVIRLPFDYVNSMFTELLATGQNQRTMRLVSQPTFCTEWDASLVATFAVSLVYTSACASLRAASPTYDPVTGIVSVDIFVSRSCSATTAIRTSIIDVSVAVGIPFLVLCVLCVRTRRKEQELVVPSEIKPLLKPQAV